MAWTVFDIRTKVKTLVGDSGLDDADLLVRINRVYRNVLPLEFVLESLKSFYTLTCIIGAGYYSVDPDTYLSLSPPCFIDILTADSQYQITLRRDRINFFNTYPEVSAAGTVTTGTPHEILYSKNTLYPRPVPDDIYAITIDAYKKPTALLLFDDVPTEDIWGPILACDVAMEILLERKDTEGFTPVSKERAFWKGLIVRKEILALGNIRAEGRI